ncbi:MAG: hypothetical protein ACOY0T_16065 [Myxococcota bacterium]
MTREDRDVPPSEPRFTLEELAFFERLRSEVRRERAPATLAARILDSVAEDSRRQRALATSAPPRPGGRWRLLASALALPAAAAVAFAAGRSSSSHSPGSASSAISREPAADTSRDGNASAASRSVNASTASRNGNASAERVNPVFDPCTERNVAVAPTSVSAPTRSSDFLIDDFEDGDDAILPHPGRQAFWRWVRETDAPGTAPALLPIPRPGATAVNRLALHVKGGRLSDWGAAVEFTFSSSCYDASAYAGIAFSARGPGRIYVAPREPAVIPLAEGGSCERDCHNPHVQKIELENRFRNYEVRFVDVRQRGLGKPPLDPKRLNSLAFLIRPEDTPYDLWIDDVRFIPR